MNAVQTYNNPLTVFKSETFIVLMVIAWTYLLHAYYRRERIEYRYYRQGPKRRKFDRTQAGAFKHWELERCLNCHDCPLDSGTKQNLRFLIGFRNEIEHHMVVGLEEVAGSKYQACCLNYEFWLTTLFGAQHSIASRLSLALQFTEIWFAPDNERTAMAVPANVKNFIRDFEANLTEEEFKSERYEYRILFTRKQVNHPGQADRAIEFVSPSSEIGEAINREYWFKREVERPKYRPKDIVEKMRADGFARFSIHYHTLLWKEKDAKRQGKGFGVEVSGSWFWYESWVNQVAQHCQEHAERYTDPIDERQAG